MSIEKNIAAFEFRLHRRDDKRIRNRIRWILISQAVVLLLLLIRLIYLPIPNSITEPERPTSMDSSSVPTPLEATKEFTALPVSLPPQKEESIKNPKSKPQADNSSKEQSIQVEQELIQEKNELFLDRMEQMIEQEKPSEILLPKIAHKPRIPLAENIPSPYDDILTSKGGEIEEPSFPGGTKAMKLYLSEHIQYPEKAIENEIGGDVIASIIVDEWGKISSIDIIQSVDPLIDAEVISVISEMPDWQPALKNGQPIRKSYQITVSFNMN